MKRYMIFEFPKMVLVVSDIKLESDESMRQYMEMYFGMHWGNRYKVFEIAKELKA